MTARLITDNGLPEEAIFYQGRKSMNVPGYFRATKNWDIIVVHDNHLVAAIEFKSQVGRTEGQNR